MRLPVLGGLLPIGRSRLGPDAVAGVTLAALAVPEVLGYARIAGMPVVSGLYTMLVPMVVFALLGLPGIWWWRRTRAPRRSWPPGWSAWPGSVRLAMCSS
ncbi:MAG: SulP family inorganic anion transporter, partial [Pseudonocardiaceae bacterium]